MKDKHKIRIKKWWVKGINLNQRTGCKHYSSPLDIIAIRFKCCHMYFSCYLCHEQLAKHPIVKWSSQDFEKKAILCGNCHKQLTIRQYLDRSFYCPYCRSQFNPGCQKHLGIYFDLSCMNLSILD